MLGALILLVVHLAIVAYGIATGGGFAAKVARLAGRTSRPRMVTGWALGTAISFGLPALFALALLGRMDGVVDMPPELQVAAWSLGLPGWAPIEAIGWFLACLATGAAIGVAILMLRRRMGKTSFGIAYRSPAAARGRADYPAAAALALAAGIAEELFFRLSLPLLVAIVAAPLLAEEAAGLAGVAIGWIAFVALHRHQGWVGLAAVAMVGAGLTWVYLRTGALWLVMLIHVTIDLNALILRPWLTRRD